MPIIVFTNTTYSSNISTTIKTFNAGTEMPPRIAGPEGPHNNHVKKAASSGAVFYGYEIQSNFNGRDFHIESPEKDLP